MNRFCGQCGTPIDPNSAICKNCGMPKPKPQPSQTKHNKKPLLLIVLCAIAVLVTIVLISRSETANDYESAVQLYEDLYNGKYSVISNMAPEEFWNRHSSTAKENVESDFAEIRESIQEDFGKNAKVQIEITDAEEIDLNDISAYLSAWEMSYEGDASDITEVYELSIDYRFSGSYGNDTESDAIYAVKIRNEWYLTDNSEFSMNFVINQRRRL